MPNQIDEKIKTLRSEDLIKTGEELTKEFRQAKIGQDTTVLFEEKSYWITRNIGLDIQLIILKLQCLKRKILKDKYEK